MIVLLLHCEGGDGTANFVDSSHPPTEITSKGGVRLSTSNSKFGASCGLFEGGGENNVLRLHFDNTPGSAEFIDTSPLGNVLTSNGNPIITHAKSMWGNSGLFNGSSSLTKQSLNFVIFADTSFDVFLSFDDDTSRQTILGIDKDDPKGLELYYDINPNRLVLNFGGTIIEYEWTPILGEWYMISMTRVGAYVYLYIQGEEVVRGFRRTGLVIEDSNLRLSNPNIPLPSDVFFSRHLPGPITAIEYKADIPSTAVITALAKQNIQITSADLTESSSLRDLSDHVLGLDGRVYFGLSIASIDGRQISIDDLCFHYASDEYHDGTLSKVQINKYTAAKNSDVLLRIPTSNMSVNNSQNILFRVDQKPVPYILTYWDVNETEIIIRSENQRDNLTTHLNMGTDTHWNSLGLAGSALDWNGANGRVKQIGYWSLEDGYWTTTQDSYLSSSESSEKFVLLSYVKKLSGKWCLSIMIDDLEWKIWMDDTIPFFTINREEFEKPLLPWNDSAKSFLVQRYQDSLIFKIDQQVVATLPYNFNETISASVRVKDFSKSSKAAVKSYYTGPLYYGNANTGFRSDLNYTYLTNDPPFATGYMLYAGIPDLDSVGLLYATEFDIFLDNENLNIPLPAGLETNSKILGFRDTKTASSLFFYSNSVGTYYYEDNEWKLLGNMKMIDLYKDQWGEGIVYCEGGSSYWVHLFERANGKLVLTGDKSIFSITPTDQEYKFEAPIDYRKRKGTIPWLWIRRKNE